MTETETMGARIQRFRLKVKPRLTQAQVAKHCGVKPNTVYRWEADRAVPEIEHLILLAPLIKTTVGKLITG
jgi:DNA-binding XRE family transcriptional regulator